MTTQVATLIAKLNSARDKKTIYKLVNESTLDKLLWINSILKIPNSYNLLPQPLICRFLPNHAIHPVINWRGEHLFACPPHGTFAYLKLLRLKFLSKIIVAIGCCFPLNLHGRHILRLILNNIVHIGLGISLVSIWWAGFHRVHSQLTQVNLYGKLLPLLSHDLMHRGFLVEKP